MCFNIRLLTEYMKVYNVVFYRPYLTVLYISLAGMGSNFQRDEIGARGYLLYLLYLLYLSQKDM